MKCGTQFLKQGKNIIIVTINVIGIGLDGVVGLNQLVREIVKRATLLVGSDRHLSYFSDNNAESIVIKDLLIFSTNKMLSPSKVK